MYNLYGQVKEIVTSHFSLWANVCYLKLLKDSIFNKCAYLGRAFPQEESLTGYSKI